VTNGCRPVAGGAGRPQQAEQLLVEDGVDGEVLAAWHLKANLSELAAAQAGEAAAGAVAGVGDGVLDARVGGGAEELGPGEVVAGGADAGEVGDVLDGQAA
jgi:hypothetical protein